MTFLLKDEKAESSADEKGYYVSREMAVAISPTRKRLANILVLDSPCLL